MLGDITCDSDGKVDQFIDRRDVKRTLPCTPSMAATIILGAFLVGAYQEILGDLHNLFGDTNAVHVRLSEYGRSHAGFGDQGRHGARGAGLRAVLVRRAARAGSATTWRPRCAKGGSATRNRGALLRFYEDGLHGYTYLEDVHEQ